MLEILGSFLTFESLDIAGLLAYVGWRRRKERRDTLLYPRNTPRRLWIIDHELAKRMGPVPALQKQAAQRLIMAARWFTNTRAFEYLITGLINPKSKWHAGKPSMSTSVRTFL